MLSQARELLFNFLFDGSMYNDIYSTVNFKALFYDSEES